MNSVNKTILRDPIDYPSIIKDYELYKDFGVYVDNMISHYVSARAGKEYHFKSARQALSSISLTPEQYSIYDNDVHAETSTCCWSSSNNCFPPHASFQVPCMLALGCSNWSPYEHHVCSGKDCKEHVWPATPKAEWEQHRDDRCSHCQGLRFHVSIWQGVRSCATNQLVHGPQSSRCYSARFLWQPRLAQCLPQQQEAAITSQLLGQPRVHAHAATG